MGRVLLARWHIVTAGLTESERGASLVEYALLGLLIAVAAAAALRLLGEATSGSFEEYTQRLNDA
jgi:Flp pilus assembly pilin Flp